MSNMVTGKDNYKTGSKRWLLFAKYVNGTTCIKLNTQQSVCCLNFNLL